MMYHRKETVTMGRKRIFFVSSYKRDYTVYGDPWTTIEAVWDSQKCWFTKGTVVTITNESGHYKMFIKE